MNSDKVKKTTKKRTHSVDWRNTLFQFHAAAVSKYGFKPAEIAVYTSLLSASKADGSVSKSNSAIMRETGIGNQRTFKKARDRLIDAGVISITRKGTVQQENTTYKVKLLGRPTPK